MSAIQPRLTVVFTVGGTTYRYATEGFYDASGNYYEGDMLEYPTLRDRLVNRFWGAFDSEIIRVSIINQDGSWDTLIGAQELRGVDCDLEYYDAAAGGSPTTLVRGKIKEWDVRDTVELTVEVRSMDPLETVLPSKLVNTTDFPYATDLGAPINIIFGNAKDVPLPYIFYDYTNDYYDYLICERTSLHQLSSVSKVYRNGVEVDSSEYTVYDGSQGSPHAGFAFIRFIVEQRMHSGELHTITADVNMTSRDFADAVKLILSDSTVGLGESVNAASFSTASSDLGTIGSMYCDGRISTQRKARNILDELCKMCRGFYDQNTSGEWTLDIDTYDSGYVAVFGHEDGYYNNILEIKSRRITEASEALKSVTLRYGLNRGTFDYENVRSVFSFGVDKIHETDFVQDHTTADKITCYWMKLAQYSDEGLEITVGEDGRNVDKREIISAIIPSRSINGNYRVEEIEKRDATFDLVLKEYSSSIYTYGAGSMPSGSQKDEDKDFREEYPNAMTDLVKVSEGAYQTDDGTTLAFIILSVDRTKYEPNFKKAVFGYKRTTESIYTLVDGFLYSGLEWRVKIEGLAPGATYDFIAYSENVFGLLSTTSNPTLQDTAVSDTSAPDVPSSVGIEQVNITNARIYWTNPSQVDFKGVQIWCSTTNDRATANLRKTVLGIAGAAGEWIHSGIGTTNSYYYWIRAVDWSDNPSSWYPSGATSGMEIAAGTRPTINELLSELFDDTNYETTFDLYYDSVRVLKPSSTYPSWVISTSYSVDDDVKHTGAGLHIYRCIQAHTSAASNEPGVGVDWALYWEQLSDSVMTGIPVFAVGEIGGQPTVGVNGDLIVDNAILARHIQVGEVDWASHVSGSGKPANGATVNNLNYSPNPPFVYGGNSGDFWYDTTNLKLYQNIGGGTNWYECGNDFSLLSHMGGDVDDIADGSSYIRAPIAWKKSGKTTIDGGQIETDTVTALQINVATLSAIAANVGTLTAGVIRSADSNIYFDLTNNELNINGTTHLNLYHLCPINFTYSGSPFAKMYFDYSNSFLGLEKFIGSYGSKLWLTDKTINQGFTFTAASPSGTRYLYWLYTSSDTAFYPGDNNIQDCGKDANAWQDIYYYVAHDKCVFLDELDDLKILHDMKPSGEYDKDGLPKLDLLSLPPWMTNRAKLREEVRHEMGDMITDEDFEELIKDDDQLGYRVFRNSGHYNDLLAGAIRKMDQRLQTLEARASLN